MRRTRFSNGRFAHKIVSSAGSVLTFALAIIVVVGLATPVLAHEYAITDLGVIRGHDTGSVANAINASGVVVGSSGVYVGSTSDEVGGTLPLLGGTGLGTHAFLWSSTSPDATTGTMTDLGAPPGNGCTMNGHTFFFDMYAAGITSANRVVGVPV